MFIDGMTMYMKEGIEDTRLISLPPRRQPLCFSYYRTEPTSEDDCDARYVKFNYEFEVPTPYSHYLLTRWKDGSWVLRSIVWSVDPIDSVDNIEDLPITSPALPNFSFVVKDELYKYREDFLAARKQCDYPMIGTGCFGEIPQETPIKCINQFWNTNFNNDLNIQYKSHPVIQELMAKVTSKTRYQLNAFDGLTLHQGLSEEELFDILRQDHVSFARFTDVSVFFEGEMVKLDLETIYAT